MNKAVRGVMRKRRVLAKAVALLCVCGSAVLALPAMAATTVTTYTYDAGNNITTVTDPRSLITAYNYDGLGQLWGVSSPDTGTTTFNYDAYGRHSSLTRANGVTTTYGYDALNRVTTISAGSLTHTFAYDSCTNGIGRLCSDSDTTGSTAYTYTPEGWIAGRGFSISGTTYSLGYGYDTMGHLAAVTYPDGHEAVYSYSDGVVSGVTFTIGSTQLTAVSSVTWQPMNTALASWTSSNGLANTLSYDTDGRLTAINTPGVVSMGFSYDTANRLTGIDNAIDGTMTENFDYDDQSRLASMDSPGEVVTYAYDADGNRIAKAVNTAVDTTSYSTTSNRLVGTTGADPQSYGFDALGNITTLGGVATFQYDAFNRMSAAGGMSYYVNPEGQRLRKTGSAATTYFAPGQGGALMAEDDSGAWIDYLWLNGRLIGREVNGQLEAIQVDQVSRPLVSTNAAQTVVWSAQNRPYAQGVTVSNSAPLNIGFPGQYYDAETGLWNNGFRDFDSVSGRYVESDPLGLGGGVNTYAYVGGNPLLYTDPYGLAVQVTIGLGGTLIVPMTGGSASVNVGINFDWWNSSVYVQAQGNLGAPNAGGYFAGAGGNFAVTDGSPPTTGTDSQPYFEADAGVLGGLGAFGTPDACGNINLGGMVGTKGGFAVGAGAFTGTSYTATAVSPNLGAVMSFVNSVAPDGGI